MPQPGHLPVVEILPRQKVEQQRESPQDANGPSEPWPPSPHMEQHEADQRDDDHEGRNVEPTQRRAELSGCLRPHHPQLTKRHGGRRHRRQGKEQIGPRRAFLAPH